MTEEEFHAIKPGQVVQYMDSAINWIMEWHGQTLDNGLYKATLLYNASLSQYYGVGDMVALSTHNATYMEVISDHLDNTSHS